MSHHRPGTRRRRTTIEGQFAPRLVEMIESCAMAALSLSGRRVLDRIEVELAHHGGAENGRLPVTYGDFVRFGLHRHAIGPAIRELVALGFVEVTEPGRAGNAEHRNPNFFRVTYRDTDHGPPTHEWRHVTTAEDAERIACSARKMLPARLRTSRSKNKIPVPENARIQ